MKIVLKCFEYFNMQRRCCVKKCDDISTDPVPLILNLCGISVKWDKLVGVLNLYWCADAVAWL